MVSAGARVPVTVVIAARDEAAEIAACIASVSWAREVLVVQAPYQWDDVGSWLALERRNAQDVAGNTVQGTHLGVDTTRCVIAADAGHVIATIGVSDLIIIQAGLNARLQCRVVDSLFEF